MKEPKVKVGFSLEESNLELKYVTKRTGMKPHRFHKFCCVMKG